MRSSPLILILLICTAIFAGGEGVTNEKPVAGAGIAFTDLGITLYGKFLYESEGELFAICDKTQKELVPPGAVLTCIRRTYSIGYFSGGAEVTTDGKKRKIPKVFFTLMPTGEVTFHEPSSDGNFFGKALSGQIVFGKLYKPISNPHATSGTDKPNNSDESAFRITPDDVEISVDRERCAKLGVSVDGVNERVKEFFKSHERFEPHDLQELEIPTNDIKAVKLSQVITITLKARKSKFEKPSEANQ